VFLSQRRPADRGPNGLALRGGWWGFKSCGEIQLRGRAVALYGQARSPPRLSQLRRRGTTLAHCHPRARATLRDTFSGGFWPTRIRWHGAGDVGRAGASLRGRCPARDSPSTSRSPSMSIHEELEPWRPLRPVTACTHRHEMLLYSLVSTHRETLQACIEPVSGPFFPGQHAMQWQPRAGLSRALPEGHGGLHIECGAGQIWRSAGCKTRLVRLPALAPLATARGESGSADGREEEILDAADGASATGGQMLMAWAVAKAGSRCVGKGDP
jgi:hypothetical protein